MIKIKASYRTQEELDAFLDGAKHMGKIVKRKEAKQEQKEYKSIRMEIDETRKYCSPIRADYARHIETEELKK